MSAGFSPLITVLLPTRDRPQLLAMALRCFAEQTWPNRELLVLDDGQERPVDEAAVRAVGGRLIRYPEPLLLGDKLNAGAEAAAGAILHKWDDDDWCAPEFIAAQAAPVIAASAGASTPAAGGRGVYSLLFVRSWRVVTTRTNHLTGQMMITRAAWETVPFPAIRGAGTDVAYFRLLEEAGIPRHQLGHAGRDLCVLIRRDGIPGQPGHTWTQDIKRRDVETSITSRRAGEDRAPEDVLPEWALAPLRAMREVGAALAAEAAGAGAPEPPA